MMYDTMPADEATWKVDPFAGELVEQPPFGRCLVARGAINTKGELEGFLNVCRSIKATGQELPVNLVFVAEGEEELGSRHLPEFVRKYGEELAKADAVFWPTCDQDPGGEVSMSLGVKGIVYFELELDGASWGKGPTQFGIHGSLKAAVDSPVWRMIQALASMTGPDGNHVLVKDLFRDAMPPDKDDLMLIEKLSKTWTPKREEEFKNIFKVKSFVDGVEGTEMLRKLLFSPTLNIDGIWGGYTGEGTKTLLPHKVTAKMDVRLVPKMRNESILPLIRKHLDDHGFREVDVRKLEEGYDWARTSYKEPAVQAVLKSYREMGAEPEVWPTGTGSAPFYLFNREPVNLPVVTGGLGHGALAHSPNEYIVIDEGGPTGGLKTLEKSYVAILDNFSKMG
jgi:acetylornithine deacetylase/succinyl-diaminopimelate desuccinylase-like protein